MVRGLAFACVLLAIPAAPWRLVGRLFAQSSGPQHIPGEQWMADAVLEHLVAAWAFDEVSGTIAADATGNGHHGTVIGATWTPAGRFGGALSFDGQNDQVLIPAHAALDLTDDFTVTAWIRPEVLGEWQTIYQNGATPNPNSWGLYLADTDAMAFVAIGHEALQGPTVTTTAWHHVAWVKDGASPVNLLMFVDGQASAVNRVPALAASGAKVIGANDWNGDDFEGAIDNVRLYNTALSVAELHADMGAGVAGTPDQTPPLVTLTAPEPGSHLSGLTLVRASATDSVWVDGVQFYLDAIPLGPEDGTAPFEVVWDTTSVADGPYVLTARARDLSGNMGWSAPAPVLVVNTSTAITLSSAAAFSCGSSSGVAITQAGDGELRLSALVEDYFEDGSLDLLKWEPGTFSGFTNQPVVADGEVSVDHAWIRSVLGLPASLSRVVFEGRVRFAGIPDVDSAFTDVGFGDEGDPLGAPNILFVSDEQNRLFANGNHPDEGAHPDRTEITGVDLHAFHNLRITVEDWRTIHYYIDGVHQHTETYSSPVFADEDVYVWFLAQEPLQGHPMTAEWLRVASYETTPGTYWSCAQDAGKTVDWTTMSWDALVAPGTTATFRTRTQTSAGTWSPWSPPVSTSGGTISSPDGRYIQVRVDLGTSDSLLSPEVRSLTLRYAP